MKFIFVNINWNKIRCMLILLAFSIQFHVPIRAQELVTDRPDYTESALVVPPRMIQVESGFLYADFADQKEFSYPNGLFRVGIGYSLEIRFGLPGWTHRTATDVTRVYFNDLLLEMKYQLTHAEDDPTASLILVSTLPTGDTEASAGAVEAGLKFACSYDFTSRMTFGMNVGAISVNGEKKREILSLASLSAGLGISDRLGAFVELFTEIPQDEAWQPVLDGGFTFLIDPELQLDISAGAGLNDYSADYFLAAGLSFRFGT